jgi:hypothetical protein
MTRFRLALILVCTLLLAACATAQPTTIMEALASDSIGVGAWCSEWRTYAPAQLVSELQNAALPAPAAVRFTELGDEEITQLIGQPPATMLGPTTTVAAALHSSGWGPEAMDEAISFVAEKDGRYSWAAFLYTSGSFAQTTNDMFPVVETDILPMLAMQDVVIYGGPGDTFKKIGGVFDGQQALVTGRSLDCVWWRVICPDDTIGDCWVTADTAFTMPVNNL